MDAAVNQFNWQSFISNWEKTAIAKFEAQGETEFANEIKLAMKNPGATEKEISDAEKKLGRKFPPSYRAFLKVRNGWFLPSAGVKLFSTNELQLLRNADPQWLEDWSVGDISVPHANNGRRVEGSHFKDTIVISEDLDGDIYLLNPHVVDSNSEWEAWAMGAKNPGVFSFVSFEEMLRREFELFKGRR